MTDSKPVKRDEDERVTLAPLDPEEALRALLKVKPGDSQPKSKKATKEDL